MWGLRVGGPVVQIGTVGAVFLTRPEYALEWLAPSAPPPVRHLSPSYLLDARHEAVPYRSRPAEEAALSEWLADGVAAGGTRRGRSRLGGDRSPQARPVHPLSVRLVHGGGGQGKTRLAGVVAGHAHDRGWAVAQAVETGPGATPGGGTPDPRPVLVVVDYAERWGATALLRMIASLPTDLPGRTVRVLLLARSAALWPALAARSDPIAELPDPIALGDLTAPADRSRAFADAAVAFGQALDLPADVAPPPDLAEPPYGCALVLHMAALAAVCARHHHERRPELAELSGYLLRHEGRFWPVEDYREAADAVFLATLFGPTADQAAARALLERAELPAAALAWHDELYPPEGRTALTPLRPDRLGEDFVAEHLASHRRSVDLLERVAADAPGVRRALIVLAASADRHAHVREVLWSLLTRDPSLARHAAAPLIDAVIAHAPVAVCAAVHDALPLYRTELLESAPRLIEHLLAVLPPDAPTRYRASLLTELGGRLAEAGEPRTGLPHLRQAVGLLRVLDDPAALAVALQGLGGVLGQVGDLDAALSTLREAVELHRHLAVTDPEHGKLLAFGLSDLGVWLAEAGERQDAVAASLEAAELYRGSGDDGIARALVLTNLGNRLAEAGDQEAALGPAREAAELLRVLAAENPAAHLPHRAGSLHNLGTRLDATGDHHGAAVALREAVAIRRRLVADHRAAYLRDLGMSLNNLGIALARTGDKSGSLASAREAVSTYRELAEADPVHWSDVANACGQLAWGQLQPGEPSTAVPEALAAAEEAVLLYLPLTLRNPGRHADDLQAALVAGLRLRALRDDAGSGEA